MAGAFDRVEYPTHGFDELLRRLPTLDVNGLRSRGVPAFGVAASLDNNVVLLVPLTLRAGGDRPDSRGWVQRKMEAAAVRSAVAAAVAASRPAGILVGGDLNLYGEREPLTILESGLDLDGSGAAAVEALDLDGRSNMTYPSGAEWPWQQRLDWLLYSDSSLEPVRAFVFDSAKLAPYWLTVYGLSVNDSERNSTSDHLPLVVDFRWRR
jgi:hypothetical protein